METLIDVSTAQTQERVSHDFQLNLLAHLKEAYDPRELDEVLTKVFRDEWREILPSLPERGKVSKVEWMEEVCMSLSRRKMLVDAFRQGLCEARPYRIDDINRIWALRDQS